MALRTPVVSKGPNTGSEISPGVIRRAPLLLLYASPTRWQVTQVMPSWAEPARFHHAMSRLSPRAVPTVALQRTQKELIVPRARSLILCSNLLNIGETAA